VIRRFVAKLAILVDDANKTLLVRSLRGPYLARQLSRFVLTVSSMYDDFFGGGERSVDRNGKAETPRIYLGPYPPRSR
jgi:hypothetical protein